MPISDRINEAFFSPQVFRARIFRRQAEEMPEAGLKIFCGGCEHCASDYRIERNRFPYWGFEFVVEGKGTVAFKGRQQALRPGAIFVYGPETAYRMESDPRHPLVKYFVDFRGRGVGGLLGELGFRPGQVDLAFPPGVIGEAFDRLIDAGLAETPRTARRLSLLLQTLLVECADLRVAPGKAEERAFSSYRRCLDLLDALEPISPALRSVEAAARACGIDPAYLCRLFRRFGHASPHRYLMRRRLTAAAARLTASHVLVKQVAEDLGFADPYHFSRVFKAFHRASPREFRLRYRA